MKKNLLFPLTFLFILLFGLASCSDNNNLKTQADVTIDFPIQELFNIAAAREGGDSTVDVSLLITVTLYVNGSQYGTPQQQEFTSQMRQSGGSFEFKDITIGSRVKATAQVDSVSIVNGQKSVYPMLKGESQELKLSKSTLELPIELEYCDTKYTDVDNLCLQFYIQKTDSSGTPLANEYELYNSVYSRTELSYEEIASDQSLITKDENFFAELSIIALDLMAKGYESKRKANGEDEDLKISIGEDGIIYLGYYWDKQEHVPSVKTITTSLNGTTYTLKLYSRGIYSITSDSGLKILGVWYCVEDDDRDPDTPVPVYFTQSVYQIDGVAKVSPGYIVNGEFVSDAMDPRYHPDIIYIEWTPSIDSLPFKFFHSDGITPITFTLSEKEWFDIYEFEDRDEEQNIVIPSHEPNVVYEVYTLKLDDATGSVGVEPEFYHSYTGYSEDDLKGKYDAFAEAMANSTDPEDPELDKLLEIFTSSYLKVFYRAYCEMTFDFGIKGYYTEKSIIDSVTKENGITHIKETVELYQTEPPEVKIMDGTDGTNTYKLYLYSYDLYKVVNSRNEEVMLGQWNTGEEGLSEDIISFYEYIYYKDNECYLSPIMEYNFNSYINDNEDDEEEPTDGVDYVTWNASTITLTYNTGNSLTSFPITFAVPEGFDIFEFEEEQNHIHMENIHAYGTVVFKNQPDICIKTPYSQEPLYINYGEALFEVAPLYREDSVSNSLGVSNMSAVLYYSGQEVPSDLYEVKYTPGQLTNANSLVIKPLNLPNGGTYIARVTVTDTNCTVTSNFILQVENKACISLDVGEEDFLSNLVQAMQTTKVPVRLELSGNVQSDPYTPDMNIYQLIVFALQTSKYPVELDMTYMTGNGTQIVDLTGYANCCSKIVLPEFVRGFVYSAGLSVEVVDLYETFEDAEWYCIYARESDYGYGDAVAMINELYAGTRTLNSATINALNEIYAVSINTDPYEWETINAYLNGNATCQDGTIFFMGE